jgi:hypothetical protein
MTAEQFRAVLRQLGLRQSNVGTVYTDAQGTPYNVPDPERLSSEGRVIVIRRLMGLMGVGQTD